MLTLSSALHCVYYILTPASGAKHRWPEVRSEGRLADGALTVGGAWRHPLKEKKHRLREGLAVAVGCAVVLRGGEQRRAALKQRASQADDCEEHPFSVVVVRVAVHLITRGESEQRKCALRRDHKLV